MSLFRPFSAILTTVTFLTLTFNAEARCHNLSSTAFAHCPKYSDGAPAVVKAAATAPYPNKALAIAQSTPQANVEANHQAAAIKAPSPPPDVPLQNSTKSSPPEDIKSLPPPTGTLAITAWGVGTQNYTCPSSSAPSATPSLVGATAELFDADDSSRPLIGHHFFNAAGNPTFDFTDGALSNLGVLQTQKTKAGDIVAPKKAAVDWLNLVSDGMGQGNLQEVYRVNTTGGKPAPGQCAGKAGGTIIIVPYHAYYWFYS